MVDFLNWLHFYFLMKETGYVSVCNIQSSGLIHQTKKLKKIKAILVLKTSFPPRLNLMADARNDTHVCKKKKLMKNFQSKRHDWTVNSLPFKKLYLLLQKTQVSTILSRQLCFNLIASTLPPVVMKQRHTYYSYCSLTSLTKKNAATKLKNLYYF